MFDVVLNSHNTVASSLDIFSQVGRGVAHDVVIPFKVKNGVLEVFGEASEFDGTLVIEFVKVERVCACIINNGYIYYNIRDLVIIRRLMPS